MGRLGYIARCIAHMDYGALFETVGKVHERSGKSRPWLFLDIVSCGLKYGAGYKDYLLLEFEGMTPDQRATFVTRGINNSIVSMLNDSSYYHIFDNKNEFYTTFGRYLGRSWLDFGSASKDEAMEFLAARDQIIAKPRDAACGVGVEKLSRSDFASLEDLHRHLEESGADIIEDVVVQHPDMARINPGSVNTIRVYSVLSEGVAHAVYACIRMGNSDRPVDNINAGGMYSPIDMETGRIAGPACDKQFRIFEAHPRTGTVLTGYQIPLWDQVLDLVREAALVVPEMGYVGWDVAITEEGPLFIEGNNHPGYDAFPQMPSQAPDKIGFLPVLRRYIKGL
ncbi:MAG: sugar-transfer associated ATP-grasp domain-containing protein [Collinsella sp.]|nr:sugar-transfer associated ATP-grasp domain-containing protein [Collinsella sp.]